MREQLEEASKLRQAIFRRGELVVTSLGKFISQDQVDNYKAFVRNKIRLIVELRQQGEMIKSEEELLKCLKDCVP